MKEKQINLGVTNYRTLHDRIVRIRGKASQHSCIECQNQAEEWSHIHDTDSEDVENYVPRCNSCHRAYDGFTFAGRKHSEESKAKMRVAKLGKPGPRLGATHTAAARQKMSEYRRGRKLGPRRSREG